jgi:hypothetical protein
MQKEQWINEIMNSLDGLQKAEGNPFLKTRILSKINQPHPSKQILVRPVFALAGLTALVMLLNIYLWSRDTAEINYDTTTVSAVNEYELTSIEY